MSGKPSADTVEPMGATDRGEGLCLVWRLYVDEKHT